MSIFLCSRTWAPRTPAFKFGWVCQPSQTAHYTVQRCFSASLWTLLARPFILNRLLLLQFFAKNGWRLQLQTDRGRQAAALGIDPELCAFGQAGSSNGNSEGRTDGSLFLVCTPAAAAAGAQ